MGRNVLQVAVHFPLIQPYTPHFAIGQVALVHIKAIVFYRDIRGIYRIHYLHAVAHKFFLSLITHLDVYKRQGVNSTVGKGSTFWFEMKAPQ